MKHLALVFLTLPLPALAHPGDHSHTGLSHFLTEPDHLALLAGVALAVAYGIAKRRAKR